MAKKFESLLVENLSKKVKHGGHKHELVIEFTSDLEASTLKHGFYDYCLRMAADKYRKLSGQDEDYQTSIEDRAVVKTIHDTGVWKTTDQVVLGSMKRKVMIEKVQMTAEVTVAVMTTEELKKLYELSKEQDENPEDHSDENEIDVTQHSAIAAG